MKEQVEKYLKAPDGGPSSTRLFSFWILKFFFIWNILVTIGGASLLAFVGGEGVKDWLNPLIVISGYILIFDILLLLAIFAPKHLGKLAEIRKIIEVVKNGNGKDPETNEEILEKIP